MRGDADGAGSCFKAWRAALWARLHDGDHAYRILCNLITQATTPDMLHDFYDQVDGDFGGPAAIAEMLIQSHSSEIELLPALPGAWSAGSVRGLRARGAATLDFKWKNGRLASVTIHAARTGTLRIRYNQIVKEISARRGSAYVLDGDLRQQTGLSEAAPGL